MASLEKVRPQWNLLMGRTDFYMDERLQWLRCVLNPSKEIPTVRDWPKLLKFVNEQALTGICIPSQRPEYLDRKLLLKWISTCQGIERRNKLLNKRIDYLFGKMEEAGFRCCLLKGQGNAEMYPNPLMRCSGDIDLWVDADEKTIYQYVKKLFPDVKASYKHINFPIFNNAPPVDVHVTPLKLYNNAYQERLQRWIIENKEEQFGNKIRLTEVKREVSVPTTRFNVVYQLGHMLVHLFEEGVGLRQIVDYYYVMKNLDASQEVREELISTIRNLGMLRFARAVMWIESVVLGLPVEQCIVEPDKRRGRRLLNDILVGGNFGHYNKNHGRKGFYNKGLMEAWRMVDLMGLAPREVMARLVSKKNTALKHAVKRLIKKTRLDEKQKTKYEKAENNMV